VSLFRRKTVAAEALPPVAQVPLCVRCAQDGEVEEGVALVDPDRPEEGRLCEVHLMAQEHAVETATGLHPADLWAIRNGEELVDDGHDRHGGNLVHRAAELGGER